MNVRLDRFGRVVIPKEIRDDLGLKPGTELHIEEAGREIVLRSVEEEPMLAVKDGVLVYRGEARGDLEGAVARDRRERIGRLK